MLTNPITAIAVSTVLGILSGLGIGGGSLLILWLTGVLGWVPEIARGVNLLFFLPGALLATLLRRKEIPWKQVWPAILSGCAAAAVVTFLRPLLPEALLRRAFGVLLLFTGLRELCYRDSSRASK